MRRRGDYEAGRPEHLVCTRRYNQMRISPLEARDIARAFREDTELRRRLPGVLEKLRRVLPTLKDNEERQSFDCPLLEGERCLVHERAKPIGCLAWHPERSEAIDAEQRFTETGWQAFAARDRLNDRHAGRNWKLRVIPLWLGSVFAKQLDRE